jgi:hypothetical protein
MFCLALWFPQGVDVVVGTPGRVKDHIERGTLKLHKLKFRWALQDRCTCAAAKAAAAAAAAAATAAEQVAALVQPVQVEL